jgi:hypothetical protein
MRRLLIGTLAAAAMAGVAPSAALADEPLFHVTCEMDGSTVFVTVVFAHQIKNAVAFCRAAQGQPRIERATLA